ncbi:Alpha-ribazole phosphatase [compost metagenome]
MEWWLIRHGLTIWNVEHRYQGHSDIKLLEGEKHGLGALQQKLKGVSFAAIYCSDLLRCRQTLEYVRPELSVGAVHIDGGLCEMDFGEVRFDSRLREMNFGEWEGKTYDMLKDIPLYRSWIDQPQLYAPPGGESWEQFQGRVHEFFCELSATSPNADEPMLIVTHGGVISMLSTFLNPGLHFWEAARVAPGEVLKVQIN